MRSGNGNDNGQARYRNPSDLTPELAKALLQWGLSLADTKHKMGLRISEWANSGPVLEAAVGACALTQDELGHARSLFAVLRDFPGAPPELGSETDLDRVEYNNPSLLDEPWDSWLDVIAVNVLLDRALSMAVRSLRHSQYAPLRQRAAKILQEEEHHRLFGDGWLKRLASLDEKTRQGLQRSIERSWKAALAFLGPDDDPATRRLLQAGIVDSAASDLRRQFEDEARQVLEKQGIPVPSSALDWTQWNPRRRELIS